MSGLDRAYLAMMYYWVRLEDTHITHQKPYRDVFSEKVSKISSVQEKMENSGKNIT